MRAAFAGLFRRTAPPQGFTYVEQSIFRILPLLILFGSPADIVIVHLILHIHSLLWNVLLVGSDVYALIWSYGVLRTMRMHPHQIVGDTLLLNKGVYASAAVPARAIQSAAVVPREKTEKSDDIADLSLRGAQKVEITLSAPLHVIRTLAPDPKPVTRIIVSADDPNGLRRAIENLRLQAAA